MKNSSEHRYESLFLGFSIYFIDLDICPFADMIAVSITVNLYSNFKSGKNTGSVFCFLSLSKFVFLQILFFFLRLYMVGQIFERALGISMWKKRKAIVVLHA